VSTAITGFPKIIDETTFAVFLPTPGNSCNNRGSDGTTESNLSTRTRAISTRCLLLLLGYVTEEIKPNTSSTDADANSSAV